MAPPQKGIHLDTAFHNISLQLAPNLFKIRFQNQVLASRLIRRKANQPGFILIHHHQGEVEHTAETSWYPCLLLKTLAAILKKNHFPGSQHH